MDTRRRGKEAENRKQEDGGSKEERSGENKQHRGHSKGRGAGGTVMLVLTTAASLSRSPPIVSLTKCGSASEKGSRTMSTAQPVMSHLTCVTEQGQTRHKWKHV